MREISYSIAPIGQNRHNMNVIRYEMLELRYEYKVSPCGDEFFMPPGAARHEAPIINKCAHSAPIKAVTRCPLPAIHGSNDEKRAAEKCKCFPAAFSLFQILYLFSDFLKLGF